LFETRWKIINYTYLKQLKEGFSRLGERGDKECVLFGGCRIFSGV
jgi:hypothetical protein